jgi:cysteine-rich repeat protein
MGRDERIGAGSACVLALSLWACAEGTPAMPGVASLGDPVPASGTTSAAVNDEASDTDLASSTGGTGGVTGIESTESGETGGEETGDEPPHTPVCGDGATEPGEECDLGAGNDPEGDCTPVCTLAACGDGYVHGTEACDDGNAVDTDACTNACALAICGDGIVHDGVELCDDGNTVDTDGCTSSCSLASCGDGFVQPPEACDDGNASNTDACLGTCLHASCGDGFVQAGVEACDDGNGANTDACLATCIAASCGDGYVQAGVEECDGGGDPEVYSCSLSCEDQQVWYYWTFYSGQAPNAQACADFESWRDALVDDHTSIRIAGTFDETGRTCTGPQATTLCNALRTGGNATLACDGHTWHVGSDCEGAIEVTADGTVCNCAAPGYALRPCIGLDDWGGAATSTCGGPNQQIYIECGFD